MLAHGRSVRSTCVIVTQVIVAFSAPWIGRRANAWGFVVQKFGYNTGFLTLAPISAGALVFFGLLMPETAVHENSGDQMVADHVTLVAGVFSAFLVNDTICATTR